MSLMRGERQGSFWDRAQSLSPPSLTLPVDGREPESQFFFAASGTRTSALLGKSAVAHDATRVGQSLSYSGGGSRRGFLGGSGLGLGLGRFLLALASATRPATSVKSSCHSQPSGC